MEIYLFCKNSTQKYIKYLFKQNTPLKIRGVFKKKHYFLKYGLKIWG